METERNTRPPPRGDRDAAKELLLDIIASSAGERFEGRGMLYKAFYLAHLYYWRDHEGVLTTYPIVNMPKGPGINDGLELIVELEHEGWISRQPCNVGPFKSEFYELARSRVIDPQSARHDAIRKALAFLEGKTFTQVSNEIHEFSHSLHVTRPGEELSIYLDLLTDEEWTQVKDTTSEVNSHLRGVFGG